MSALVVASRISSYDDMMPQKRLRKPAERYYHLSHADNAASIRDQGIEADRNDQIFLFTNMLVANVIAKSQVFVERYVVFEIASHGIRGPLETDNVAEFSHPFQRLLKQSRIEPEYLSFVGTYDTITDYPTDWDYLLGERLGKSREYVDEEFSAQREYVDAMANGMSQEEAAAQHGKRMRHALKRMRERHHKG